MTRGISAKFSAITQAMIESRQGQLPADFFIVLMTSTAGSYPDGARALNLKLGTYKSRLHRAREALRATYKHPNGAPMYAKDWTLLDDQGNRSIFDDVDE